MELIDNLVEKTIPIYTLRNPHPVKRRPDCNLTKDYKRLQRERMRNDLSLPGLTKEREIEIVNRYREKTKDL